MTQLEQKYLSVLEAAKSAGISNLATDEKDGKLYVQGTATSEAQKEKVWDALGVIDPSFSASDINLNIQLDKMETGKTLFVETEETALNIRQEPSTDAKIIGKAPKGDRVTLVEHTSDDWYKIRTSEGVEGYCYARYLKGM